uniref:Uncharacterized protein n=1 Tax=Rhizophora mucronata TaxID=61149 RepID=A0A2P2P530_RHIMU
MTIIITWIFRILGYLTIMRACVL